MKNFIQRGDTITVPSPADVSSGELVIIGSLIGVAAGDAATGDDLDIVTRGVFELPKVAASEFAVGDDVFYDDATDLLTPDDAAGENTRIGVAVTAAPNPSATVAVRLG